MRTAHRARDGGPAGHGRAGGKRRGGRGGRGEHQERSKTCPVTDGVAKLLHGRVVSGGIPQRPVLCSRHHNWNQHGCPASERIRGDSSDDSQFRTVPLPLCEVVYQCATPERPVPRPANTRLESPRIARGGGPGRVSSYVTKPTTTTSAAWPKHGTPSEGTPSEGSPQHDSSVYRCVSAIDKAEGAVGACSQRA